MMQCIRQKVGEKHVMTFGQNTASDVFLFIAHSGRLATIAPSRTLFVNESFVPHAFDVVYATIAVAIASEGVTFAVTIVKEFVIFMESHQCVYWYSEIAQVAQRANVEQTRGGWVWCIVITKLAQRCSMLTQRLSDLAPGTGYGAIRILRPLRQVQ
jgi:hypothetical protein